MSGMTIFLAVGDEHTSTLPDGASLVSISFLAAKRPTGERWEVFTANGLYGRTAGAWIDSETIVRSHVDPQVMVAARPVDQHRETNGKRHDPADGTPAVQDFYPDGTPMTISHYTNDETASVARRPAPSLTPPTPGSVRRRPRC